MQARRHQIRMESRLQNAITNAPLEQAANDSVPTLSINDTVTGGKNMEQQLLELGEEESVLEEQLAGGTLSAEEEAAIRARLAQIDRMRKRLARSRMKSPAQELGYDAVQVRPPIPVPASSSGTVGREDSEQLDSTV